MNKNLRYQGLAGAALILGLLSGCGEGSASPGIAGAGTSAPTSDTTSSHDPQSGLLAFSQCMREHGIKGFPDPDSDGGLSIDQGQLGISMDSERFKKARAACEHLVPTRSTEQRQRDYRARLKYAACMRKNGVPDFPDPPVPSSGPHVQEGNENNHQGGPDPSDPQVQAAQEACKHLLPEGDEGPSLSGKK